MRIYSTYAEEKAATEANPPTDLSGVTTALMQNHPKTVQQESPTHG
jgi:hypothetical protein